MIMKKLAILFVLVCLATCWEHKRMLQRDGFSDPLCAVFDQQTGDCLGCICRGYFDKNRQCRPVSDLCKAWNINTGQCTNCYRGYEFNNGTCVTIPNFMGNVPDAPVVNPNCLTDDGNGKCLTCLPYYILRCGDCQTTGENPFCSRFDFQNVCVDCDAGYQLDFNNVCQQESLINPNNTDNSTCEQFPNCVDCNSQECTKCEQGFRQQYYSRECVAPTQNCTQGCALCSPNECFACEAGYSANSWPICTSCSYMYTRNSQGKCTAIQSDCSAYPNCQQCVVGQCVRCAEGYELNANLECVSAE